MFVSPVPNDLHLALEQEYPNHVGTEWFEMRWREQILVNVDGRQLPTFLPSLLIPEQFFVYQFAEDVSCQNMGFLNSGRLIAGDADAMVNLGSQLSTALAGEPDRN